MIRLVSDLHIDINKDSNFKFRYLNDYDALFIAGDIAGSYQKETKFLKKLSKQINKPIFVVAGNHLGYDYYTKEEELDSYLYGYKKENPLDGTKQFSIDYIKNNTPNNVYYLDNEYIEFQDYIIFGGCMYSDYKLYPNEDLSKRSGEAYLNDFRYVRIYDKELNIVRIVNTDDYQEYFKIFMDKLNNCIKETNKNIIVLSHFCPSIKSISDKYLNQGNIYLNASYASNLEQFIINNPRIKYWFCGHCHDPKEYEIEQCKVYMYPYGYKGYEQTIPVKKWEGRLVNIQ